jgi:hypothetical protein
MVDKITSSDTHLSFPIDNTGNGLADFVPPRDTGIQIELPTPPLHNTHPSTPFSPNPNHTAILNNYRQSYETPMMRGGIPNGANSENGTNDGKVADRLSYIIHLLEEMKNEKTNNVTEEFVLYSLLGIFVIYLVDAFARTGKYTR